MKPSGILMAILMAALFVSGAGLAACPSADLTGDCKVDLADLSMLALQWLTTYDLSTLDAMAAEWLTEGTSTPVLIGLTWVSINDDGSGMRDKAGNPISEGGFIGEMSKYEITNLQFAKYLNDALASEDITMDITLVKGASGPYAGQNYYATGGNGENFWHGVTRGGASRIKYQDGAFIVESGFEHHPVTYVSWYGAMSFAGYYGWRLPTEWEWQAVADYDGTFIHGCGVIINNSIANYTGSLHPDGTTIGGAFGSYGYGMADMAGNVAEWTSTVDSVWCIHRGGRWNYFEQECRVYNRIKEYPHYQLPHLGFRVCR